MASPKKRVADNVAGDLFIDSGCIDCGTCRWMAPQVFTGRKDQSFVHTQPDEASRQRAFQAIIACPTGSIGTETRHDLKPAMRSFPDPIVLADAGHGPDGIYDLGFHSRDSFGATSYLIVRGEGRDNIMVDSPRFNRGLVERVEALGGVQHIFLTHRDDVADHERYAESFGAERTMHVDDKRHMTRNVEHLIAPDAPISLDVCGGDELLVIPTPGHTKGSLCLLYTPSVNSEDEPALEGGPFLFSGDHLAWDIMRDRLFSFRGACWYDWAIQIESTEALLAHDFAWVLPGHGPRGSASVAQMRQAVRGCAEWMRRKA